MTRSRLSIGRTKAAGREVVVLALPVADAALSEAERGVVAAALRGLSNAEIATERGVSARTVANQLASAYGKLGVRGRSELAALLAGRQT